MYSPAMGSFGLDQLLEELHPRNGNGHSKTVEPPINFEETEGDFKFYADMPGLSPTCVDVLVQNGVLIITGNRPPKEGPEPVAIHQERRWTNYYKQIPLGEEVDPSQIETSCENGVLEVTLPRKPQPQPRQIPATVGQPASRPPPS